MWNVYCAAMSKRSRAVLQLEEDLEEKKNENSALQVELEEVKKENNALKEQLNKAQNDINELLVSQGENFQRTPPAPEAAPSSSKKQKNKKKEKQVPVEKAEYPPDTTPSPMGWVDRRRAALYYAHTSASVSGQRGTHTLGSDWLELDEQRQTAAFAYSKKFTKELKKKKHDAELNK